MQKDYRMKTVCIAGIGTIGTIYRPDGQKLCRTVEREWMDNQPSVSCIPAGRYEMVWTDSPKYGRALALVNENLGVSISGDTTRTHILIHAANWPTQLLGCIAPGKVIHPSRYGVSHSRLALKDVYAHVGKNIASGLRCFLDIERAHAE